MDGSFLCDLQQFLGIQHNHVGILVFMPYNHGKGIKNKGKKKIRREMNLLGNSGMEKGAQG